MEFLQLGMQAVQRNWRVFLFYTLLISSVATAFYFVNRTFLSDFIDSKEVTLSMRLYRLAFWLVLSGVTGFTQAIAFSWFVADIDRPLRRLDGIKDALSHFFLFWFAVNLLQYFLIILPALVNLEVDTLLTAEFLLMLPILISIVAMPLGTGMMYVGKVDRALLSDALQPFTTNFASATAICCFYGFSSLFLQSVQILSVSASPWIAVLLDPAFCYIDCLTFCALFHLCIQHRDAEPPEIDDLF